MTDVLPPEVVRVCLSFLPIEHVLRASLTCKDWKTNIVNLALINYSTLDLSFHAPLITDSIVEGLFQLYSTNPTVLKHLSLNYCARLSSRVFGLIANLFASSLETFSLKGVTYPEKNEAVARFWQAMTSLRFVDISTGRVQLSPALCASLQDMGRTVATSSDPFQICPNFIGRKYCQDFLKRMLVFDAKVEGYAKRLLKLDPQSIPALRISARGAADPQSYYHQILKKDPYDFYALSRVLDLTKPESQAQLFESQWRKYERLRGKMRQKPFNKRYYNEASVLLEKMAAESTRQRKYDQFTSVVETGIQDLQDLGRRNARFEGRFELNGPFASPRHYLNRLFVIKGMSLFDHGDRLAAYNVLEQASTGHFSKANSLLYLLSLLLPEKASFQAHWKGVMKTDLAWPGWDLAQRSLLAGVCTKAVFEEVYIPQWWFHCQDCQEENSSVGLCYACATSEHKGHRVHFQYFSSGAFCDCTASHKSALADQLAAEAKAIPNLTTAPLPFPTFDI